MKNQLDRTNSQIGVDRSMLSHHSSVQQQASFGSKKDERNFTTAKFNWKGTFSDIDKDPLATKNGQNTSHLTVPAPQHELPTRQAPVPPTQKTEE